MTPRHRHDWRPASPVDPAGDPGAVAARQAAAYEKTTTFACACGASKMILFTNGFANAYVTGRNGRLWRGRRPIPRDGAPTGRHGQHGARRGQRLLIPARAEDPATGTIGDGMLEIGPDHPDFQAWVKWLASEAAGGRETVDRG